MIPLHPIKTPPLSGPDVGWFRPALAVVLAMFLPALLAILFLFWGAPTIAGPPKDGSGYSISDHIDMVLAALAASVLVSWMVAPFAMLLLRAAAMLGFAGWGMAAFVAFALGLPTVHFALMGDLATEDTRLLPHIIIAIAMLGLSVWVAFWGLFALRKKRIYQDGF